MLEMGFYQLLQPPYLSPPATLTTVLAATLVVFCFFLNWILQLRNKGTNDGSRLPPGPFPWPIIGNLHQLKPPAHRTLTDLAHKYGPIMFLRLGSVSTVVISSSEMAKHFLKTHDSIFVSRPPTAAAKYLFYNSKDVLTAPYGEYWRQMRKICVTELLTAKRMESFRHVREEEACLMIRSIWEESERGTIAVNVSKAISTFSSNTVWRILASRKISDYELGGNGKGFKDLLLELSAILGAFNIGDFIPFLDWFDLQGIKGRMKKANKIFDELGDKIIDDHLSPTLSEGQTETGKDFVDVLLEMQQPVGNDETERIKITRENIKAIVLDMFGGGTDTSAITVEWAMSELLRHPHAMKTLQKEIDSAVSEHGTVKESDLVTMKYLRCVLKETLRLYPPGPIATPHESVEAVRVGGYYIPKKSMLMVNLWAIGRDPNVWGADDVLEFKPERFMQEEQIDLTGTRDFRMLPFGAGRRGCPGAPMAIPMIELALVQLLHNFDWKFEGDLSQMDMTEACAATIARQVPLFAVPSVRRSVPNYSI